MKRCLLVAITLAAVARAQYPPDTKWRKIETAHFEVVFPREIEVYAERVANQLEALYTPLTQTVNATPARVTVILANQGVTRYSGGYVSLFPREAVFNTMPAQGFFGTSDWSAMLAANAGSYLVQIEKDNRGFGKLAKTIFGESGRAFTLAMTTPEWSLEGQARAAASTLTRGGIGQYGSSETATRALLMSGEHFSYMKAIHGSYKDQVPSQAELGGFLVSHVNRTAGPDAWDKILNRTATHSFSPLALSESMKKVTGESAAGNYYATMSEIGEKWKSEAPASGFSNPRILSSLPRIAYTGYYQPTFAPDGSVLAQKIGLDTYPVELVRIHPDGHEEKILKMAPTVNGSNRTSVVNGKLVLDEYIADVRWRRGYSEIVVRDLNSGRTRRLTHRTRFMSPVFSPDAKHIAVVEFLPDRSCSLVILDAETGKEARRLPSPSNDMVYSPAWSDDGKRVAMVTQGAGGRALRVASVDSGTFQDAIPPSDDDIVNPVFYRDYVLYSSSYDGVSNIYAVEPSSGKRYRVTSSKYGANYPSISPDGTRLLYSDYTARGFNAAELPLDPASWTSVADVARTNINYYGAYRDPVSETPAVTYPVSNYSPSAHLFTVHSWGPTSGPPNLGVGLISDDKMGLLGGNASLIYNTNERTFGFQSGFSYNRFFPVLDFSFADKGRSIQLVSSKLNFTERTLFEGFHIPLNLSRGYYRTGLSFGAGTEAIAEQGTSLQVMNYSLGFRRERQSSSRDLAPVWAQAFHFDYRQAPWHGLYTANFLSTDGRFALPGLVRHQSLVLEAGYERESGTYYFSSEMQFIRGYRAITGTNFTKLSATYELPLFYPDWALSQLLYIKRVSMNLFDDYGRVGNLLYRSQGVELLFDLNLLHFPPTLRGGVRYAYLWDYRSSRVQPFVQFSW